MEESEHKDITYREGAIFKAKVEINPGTEDAEVADCYVTDQYLLIESREPLHIPLYMVEEFRPSFGGMTAVTNRFKLRSRDESGQGREVELGMRPSDGASLQSEIYFSYPRGFSR